MLWENERATVPAPQRALGIVELLEMVLLNLPPLEVLRLQGVSHHWRNVICGSPKLLKRLFLVADNNPRTTIPNPYLDAVLQGFACRAICSGQDTPGDEGVDRRYLHCEPWTYGLGYGEDGVKPSWRWMLLTQPPNYRLELRVHSGVFSDGRWASAGVQNLEGLRMDDVFNAYEEMVSVSEIIIGLL